MSITTVFRAFSPAEAQVVKTYLEAAGIPTVVLHETASLTTEGYTGATGGVRVQVPDDRVEEAKTLLAAKIPQGKNGTENQDGNENKT